MRRVAGGSRFGRGSWALLGLLSASLLLGCESTGDQRRDAKKPKVVKNERGSSFQAPGQEPPTPRIDLDDFSIEWEEISINNKGLPDPVEVARWTTERHNAVLRCLRNEPQAIDQAVELLRVIIKRVPSSSRDRYLLARYLWHYARYWFAAANKIAWHMDDILYEKTGPDGKRLSEKEIERLMREYRRFLKRANAKLRKRSLEALTHLREYASIRPEDKSVLQFFFTLHFFLQDYTKALEWVEYLLWQMDQSGVSSQEPYRKDLELCRERMRDYLADLRIRGKSTPKGDFSPVPPFFRTEAGEAVHESIRRLDRR